MLKRFLLEKVGITGKDFFTVFFLLFNAFTWWYATLVMMDDLAKRDLVIWTIYYVALIGSGLISSVLSYKVQRINFLYVWIFLGTATSSLPAILGSVATHAVWIVSLLWGLSFGLGIPSCISYFADCTQIENRGRVGGSIYLAIILSLPFFVALFGMANLMVNSMISVVWRGFGLILFFLLKPKEKIDVKKRKNPSFVSIFHERSFILYVIPWVMFCLVNRLEEPILRNFFEADFYTFMIMTESILGSLFAFIGGVLSDFIGRKRMIIYGFVTLGLAYAFIGIAPDMRISWYFYSIIDGIAWGIFMVIFVLVLWGDLSSLAVREKYYVIGSIPFLLTDLMQLFLTPYAELIPASAAFSLASLFLFVAVLPLMYASETLPEKKIELRKLRKYAEKAKKVKEKFVEKSAED